MLCPHCFQATSATEICPICGTSLSPRGYGLPQGTRIGTAFRVLEVLGQGGFGITYRAQHNSGTDVAIKEYVPAGVTRHADGTIIGGSNFKEGLGEFLEEGRVLSRFQHPGIVRVLEVLEERGTAYLVMEFAHGQTLQAMIDQKGSLSGDETLEVAQRVAEALEIVHASNLLHQDLKPDNLVKRPDGHITLIDFGAARSFSEKTGNYDKIVTPGFAPLELYGSAVRRGPYSDVYGLAATLYATLTGAPPPAATDRALSGNTKLKGPRTQNPTVSTSMDRGILWGLEMQASKRPQSATDFVETLDKKRGRKTYTQATTQPRTTPHLDRAKAILTTLSTVQDMPTGAWRCPTCQTGELKEVHGIQACPICAGPPPTELKPNTPFTCPDCQGSRVIVFNDENALFCPACTRGTLHPPRSAPLFTCPDCRQDSLVNRVPSRHLCPHCRIGRLEKRSNTASHCPACRVGSLKETKPGILAKLSLNSANISCDHCKTKWSRTSTGWRLVRTTGKLKPYLGQTHKPDVWQTLITQPKGLDCPHCGAEFNELDNDTFELAWTPEPNSLVGRALTQLSWAKVAQRRTPTKGTHECPNCAAEFDLHTGSLSLVSSPSGRLKPWLGQSFPVQGWAFMAAGHPRPNDDLVCTHCRGLWGWDEAHTGIWQVSSETMGKPIPRLVSRSELGLRAQGKHSGHAGFLCPICDAEWDREHSRYRQIRGLHIDETHTLERWQGKSIGRQSERPGTTCLRCKAEWVTDSSSSMLELVYGGEQHLRLHNIAIGTRRSPQDWARLAAGKLSQGPGVRCDRCHSEFTQTGTLYTLSYPETARMFGKSMTALDWARLAHGLTTSADRSQLEHDGQMALRAALIHGEWTAFSNPPVLAPNERVLCSLQAYLGRKTGTNHVPGEQGMLVITSHRLIFDRANTTKTLEIPLSKIIATDNRDNVLRLERSDRERPTVFYPEDTVLSLKDNASELHICLDAALVAELIQNQLRNKRKELQFS